MNDNLFFFKAAWVLVGLVLLGWAVRKVWRWYKGKDDDKGGGWDSTEHR